MADIAVRQAIGHPACLPGSPMMKDKRRNCPEENLESRKRHKIGSAGKSNVATGVRHNEPKEKEHERSSGILPDIFPSTKLWDRGNNPARQQLLREKLREERRLKENKPASQDTANPNCTSRDEETGGQAELMKPPRDRTGSVTAGKPDISSLPSASTGTTMERTNDLGTGSEDLGVDMAEAMKGMAYARLATPARQDVKIQKTGSTTVDAAQKARGPQPTTVYPQDWSLKTSAHFLSSESFDWCRSTSSLEDYEGLHNFVHSSQRGSCISDNNASGSGRASESASKGATFKQALHSWIYPELQLPKRAVIVVSDYASQGESAEADYLQKRQRGWEVSFQSLYHAFRNRKCDSFYYCTPLFVVFFCAGSTFGCQDAECCAYVTRSTRGLRELLLKEAIDFRMPLVLEEAMNLAMEDRSEPPHGASSLPDNSPLSLILIEGGKHLNGLFELLLNYRHFRPIQGDGDVPTLLAPIPFHNACLQSTPFNSKHMKRAEVTTEQGAGNGPAGMEDVYSLEFKRVLLPVWTISKLCDLFKVSQHGQFEASFTTAPLTEFVNVPLASRNAPASVTNAFGSTESSHARRRYDFGPNIVSRLRCQESLYYFQFSERLLADVRGR